MNKEDIEKEIRFHMEYIPKFIKQQIKNFKHDWLNFLLKEKETLVIKNYAKVNKRLNEKHGNFDKDIGDGGVIKAFEITTDTQVKMAHVGEEKNFQEEVKKRTDPYTHLATKPDYEKLINEKQKEFADQGLGKIIAICEEGKKDDGRREEEERT